MKFVSDSWVLYALMGYALLFTLTAFGLAIWRAKRRKDRPPLKFKLLRGPGETLRRKVAKIDEDMIGVLIGVALVPVVGLAIPFGVFSFWKPTTWAQLYAWAAFAVIVFAVFGILALRWAIRYVSKWRDYRLGYLGEREVGEHMSGLILRGYRVFHDIPADGEAVKVRR